MPAFDGVLITIAFSGIAILVPIIISSQRTIHKVFLSLLVIILFSSAIVFICSLARKNNWESDLLNIEPHTLPEESSETTSQIDYNNNSSMDSAGWAAGCESEAHGRVKTTSELDGFIYKLSNEDHQQYFHPGKNPAVTDVEDAEPLHHVIIDFSNHDYIGKEIVIERSKETHGLQIVDTCEEGIIDLYISEGSYDLLTIDKESNIVDEEVNVEIDHCGTYVV